jgi:hypothetical protein
MRRLTIDRYTASDDQFFHIAARPKTGVCQHLVQFWRVIICGQVASYRLVVASALGGVFRSRQLIEGVGGHKAERGIGVTDDFGALLGLGSGLAWLMTTMLLPVMLTLLAIMRMLGVAVGTSLLPRLSRLSLMRMLTGLSLLATICVLLAASLLFGLGRRVVGAGFR